MAARTKRKSRRSTKLTIPLAIVGGFVPGVKRVYDNKGSRVYEAIRTFTGYDTGNKSWSASNLSHAYIPIALGFAVHEVVGKMLGVNRMLGRMKIPLVRI